MTRTPAAQSSRIPAAPEAAGHPLGVLTLAGGRGRPQNEHRVSPRQRSCRTARAWLAWLPLLPTTSRGTFLRPAHFCLQPFPAGGGGQKHLTGKQRAPRTVARSSASRLPGQLPAAGPGEGAGGAALPRRDTRAPTRVQLAPPGRPRSQASLVCL